MMLLAAEGLTVRLGRAAPDAVGARRAPLRGLA